MALISPGVEVTVIDESQYIPAATNSVPYFLIATAQNKVSGAGVGVAAGTLAANANKVYLINSQRDLAATFGVPFFYKTTAGTPINGYELNEYGLLAAYSSLGVSNQAYVQRVDIDLTELTATLTRPTSSAPDGTYWLDVANTTWGVFQWNQTTSTFTNKVPTVITSSGDLIPSSTTPLSSIGGIGDYAVVVNTAITLANPIYYKRGGPTDAQAPNWVQAVPGGSATAGELYNTWVLVGSDEWKTSWPTVQGTLAPTTLTAGNTIFINGTEVTIPAAGATQVTDLADNINQASIAGVFAASIGGKLTIYCTSDATADGSTGGEGAVVLENGTGTPLTGLGIPAATTFYAPALTQAPSYGQPRWRATDTQPEPTGSVWIKTNNVNLGANLVLKKYSSTLGVWVQQTTNIYDGYSSAIYALDPSGGGINIPVGTTIAIWDPTHVVPDTASLYLYESYQSGATVVTGSNTFTSTETPFTTGDYWTIRVTVPGSSTLQSADTDPIAGTGTVADYLTAASSAGLGAYIDVSVNSSGAIVYTHKYGGEIVLVPGVGNTGNPTTEAGFIPGTTVGVNQGPDSVVALSKFVSEPTFTYTATTTAPDQDPADGRLWYYSATNQADIMIQNNGQWCGYQTVTNDVRGFNLSQTNPAGPFYSTTAPTEQSDATPLVPGDLWIDTSDLENYPKLYRWENINGEAQWVSIDNTDQTTDNGILFADARWAPNGDTDPIVDPIPPIATGTDPLIQSNYVDPDAPEPTLYPQGMLLWNTRRSGYNVKSFQVNYFNATDYPSFTGTVTNAWVTASGNRANGSPYMGRNAQRALIVQALKSGIDSSVDAREEQRIFNLIACPQYPELIDNMIVLNNDRNNTAFVVGDTPLRLGPDGTAIQDWANNAASVSSTTEDGLVSRDVYCGVFYPSCQTTDLSGSAVVQPPSHMMVRTIIRSDEASYPWLAPAGTRRGVIDNAARIGYINAQTGEFVTLGVRQGLRDVLYENSINPITFVPGVGITNFGNKTTTGTTSALDRINVARLVAFIRGRLEEIGKQYLFEPNDQITRNEISNAVSSLMIDLINKRGIYDYLVVCDLSNNTPARIDRNELWVDIAIEPVKAVEFIYIPMRIKNTGEIAASVATTAQAS